MALLGSTTIFQSTIRARRETPAGGVRSRATGRPSWPIHRECLPSPGCRPGQAVEAATALVVGRVAGYRSAALGQLGRWSIIRERVAIDRDAPRANIRKSKRGQREEIAMSRWSMSRRILQNRSPSNPESIGRPHPEIRLEWIQSTQPGAWDIPVVAAIHPSRQRLRVQTLSGAHPLSMPDWPRVQKA